jgi:DNA polymerase I-like protein with 3'-5' exonuclease and polymerase domains
MAAATTLTTPAWLLEADTVALDIETTGLDPFRDVVTCIAISDGKESAVYDTREIRFSDVGAWLGSHVFDGKRVITHNGQFDYTFLRRYTGIAVPPKLFDTLIGEKLLTAGVYESAADEDDDDDETRRKASRSLQAAAQRRLGVYLSKDQDVRTGFKLDTVWTDEMIEYAANDVKYLIPLFRAQSKALVAQDMVAIAKIEMAVLPVFVEMTLRGMYVDVAGMEPLLDKARREASAYRDHLEGLLTKHVLWARKRRNDEVEKRFADWRQRQEVAKNQCETSWRSLMGDDVDYARSIFQQTWSGLHIEGAKNPITNEEIETWLDQAPKDAKKGDLTPKGQARYVKRIMQYWATTDEGKRPTGDVIDVTKAINLRSWQQKQAALFDYIEEYNREHGTKLEPPDNYRKGTLVGWSLDAPEQVYSEVIEPLLGFAKTDKLLTSFGEKLMAMLDHESVIHGGWNSIGTDTGRPSCSAPNLLNMPNNGSFRGRFRARPGHLYVVADYSQMELRELAEFSGDPEMLRAFRDGIDLHTLTASAIFGVALDDVTDEMRKRAKIVNFGIAYGMAERGLRRAMMGWGIRVSEAEAAEYLAKWRELFSVAWAWIESKGSEGIRNGFTSTPLGRRRFFDTNFSGLEFREKRYRQGKIRREAANHPIQGGNADVTKLAMVLIQEELEPLGGSIVAQVYDEIVCEVPAEHAFTAKEVVAGCMRDAAATVLKEVPIAVDAVVSPSWNEKEAVAA